MKIKKYYKLNFDIVNLLVILLLTAMLFWTQTNAGTANYTLLKRSRNILLIATGFVLLAKQGYIFKPKAVFNKDFLLIISPYLFITIVSLFEVFLGSGITWKATIRENSDAFIPCTIAYVLFYIYREKLIDFIYIACVINYTFYIILFGIKYGPGGYLRIFQIMEMEEKMMSKTLEVHEVTFMFGLLLIYYLINYKTTEKRKIIITLLYFIIGNKRILFASVALALVGYIYFKKQARKVWIWSFGLLVIVFGWLFFVNSPFYELSAMALGIELNSRTFSNGGLYGQLAGYYTMSPFYIGHGVGFVHSVMISQLISGAIGTSGFHNDILKYYIDLGFIPFTIFIVSLVCIIPSRLKRDYSAERAVRYLAFLTLTLICWTTDNLATYPNYLLLSFVLYYCTVMGNEMPTGELLNENCSSNSLR